MKKRAILILCALGLFANSLVGQSCGYSVTSTNGWTAYISFQATGIVPEFTDCPWYYHFGVAMSYTITFTGSTTSRSVQYKNFCFTCQDKGGACTTCNNNLGTFTANTVGTATITNNSCEYDATSAYNYGTHPSCTTISLSNAGCTSAKFDVTGNGITYTANIPCSGILPFPIELLNFGASRKNDAVMLSWTTATETNNNYFTLEKSHHPTEGWEEVARIKGANTSLVRNDYYYSDKKDYAGIVYYQLKQTDNNGEEKIVGVTLVDMDTYDGDVLLSPNPSTGQVNVAATNFSDDQLQLELYDLSGKLVWTSDMELSAGNSVKQLQLPSCEAGIYLVKAHDSTKSVCRKLVITNP